MSEITLYENTDLPLIKPCCICGADAVMVYPTPEIFAYRTTDYYPGINLVPVQERMTETVTGGPEFGHSINAKIDKLLGHPKRPDPPPLEIIPQRQLFVEAYSNSSLNGPVAKAYACTKCGHVAFFATPKRIKAAWDATRGGNIFDDGEDETAESEADD